MRDAVVLFSGGLDSTTVLAMAHAQGFNCHAVSFTYSQRHDVELEAAKRLVKTMAVASHRILSLPIGEFAGSALTDHSMDVPDFQDDGEIPSTYVPARNTIFLSLALGLAESMGAQDIFIGASAIDYSGYPDCRPEYFKAFNQLANLATKQGVEGDSFKVHTPLIALSKAQTIEQGIALGIDYSQTVSCYQADAQGLACGRCDSCVLRQKGFADAGVADCTRYVQVAAVD